ncbi:DUF2304 domain-containing protein [Leucobacter sp. OH2974_COT-288]|nr:DUF2304 domain-containing protein [Leucobacter sp. OH2974_COT-288]
MQNMLWIIIAFLMVAWLILLVRAGRLRERYIITWVLVALGILALSIFPGVLDFVAHLLGFAVPANLLFIVALVLLLVLTVQQSVELTRGEDKTRALAEQVAILDAELRELKQRVEDPPAQQ